MVYKNYLKYKNGKKFRFVDKHIKQFWDTNPTEKQEYLRTHIVREAIFYGIILGMYIGALIILIGVKLWQ